MMRCIDFRSEVAIASRSGRVVDNLLSHLSNERRWQGQWIVHGPPDGRTDESQE